MKPLRILVMIYIYWNSVEIQEEKYAAKFFTAIKFNHCVVFCTTLSKVDFCESNPEFKVI